MKKGRQEKILELISKNNIETQDDLIAHLKEEGYNVTQATISRDIRDLDLIKAASPDGVYRYVVSHISQKSVSKNGFLHSLSDTVHNIVCAQNIVVIKTHPGMAQALGIAIDKLSDENILGSVAGDDTIIVVTPDNDRAQSVAQGFRKLFSLQ